jgi:hypothetical protein
LRRHFLPASQAVWLADGFAIAGLGKTEEINRGAAMKDFSKIDDITYSYVPQPIA